MQVPENIKNVIKDLCKQNIIAQGKGYGPFCAAICDENGTILSVAHNSVVMDNSSISHAEVNAIRQIQSKYNTYDLSGYNLSICVTAEPCTMCIGAIMWSGIKKVYYGLPSEEVELISGFIEGYKPNWAEYFSTMGISVSGGIEIDECRKVLEYYVSTGKIIYKPDGLNPLK